MSSAATTTAEPALTFDEVEEALLGAEELRRRIPVQGRFRLGAGCSWPTVLRRREDGDYPDDEARPRGFVTSVEVSELEAFEALVEQAVGAGDMHLVRLVVRRKLAEPHAVQFWPVVLVRERQNEEKLARWATEDRLVVFHSKRARIMTSDGLRVRYGRAVTRVVKALQARRDALAVGGC